jgi:hypothetical protein
MIKIWVVIKVRLENNLLLQRYETLVIDRLAPQVSKEKLFFGRWTSHSKYLGRTLSGNYYLRDWHLENVGPGISFADPVGFFLDSVNTDAAFLTLGNFLPLKLASGYGDLLGLDLEGTDLPMVDELRVRWIKD